MTWLTSVFVRVGRLFMRVLSSRRIGTWPSPSPTWTTMIGTFVPRTRVMRLRSPSDQPLDPRQRTLGDQGHARPADRAEDQVAGARIDGDGLVLDVPAAPDVLEDGARTPGWPAIR